MNAKLKKIAFWWFGIREDQPKNENILLASMMAVYYIIMFSGCFTNHRNSPNLIYYFVLIVIMISIGIAYRITRYRRLKREDVIKGNN